MCFEFPVLKFGWGEKGFRYSGWLSRLRIQTMSIFTVNLHVFNKYCSRVLVELIMCQPVGLEPGTHLGHSDPSVIKSYSTIHKVADVEYVVMGISSQLLMKSINQR